MQFAIADCKGHIAPVLLTFFIMERHYSFFGNIKGVAALVCCALVVSCTHGSVGRRDWEYPDDEHPSRGVQMVQKGSWTINYDGRYPVIDTDGLTYMVDGITLKTNDSETYYLDVIKKEDYTGSYKSSPYTAASAHLAALKKAGVQPSSGDSETYFDIGDEGGVDWIALAFGVNSRGELSGSYQIKEYTTQNLKAEQIDSWKLEYKGRELLPDGQGGEVFCEMISAVSNTDESYTIDITYDDFIKNNFGGDLMEYFWYVSDFVNGMVEEGKSFSDYLYYGSVDVDFNRLKADSWTAYAIGMDAYGNPTGHYAKVDFNIIPENPTDGFLAWLGEWDVTGMGYTLDANGNRSSNKTEITYRIKVETYDPNYDYLITGWESSISSPNQLDFLAGYDKSTQQLYFYSQYILSNSDDEGDYETLLLGEVRSGSQTYFLTDEGLKIAKATVSEDGTEANVEGCPVSVIMDDNNTFDTNFILMQYYDIYLDSDTFYTYNDVPEFPFTMKKVGTGKAMSSPKSAGVPAERRAVRPSAVRSVSGVSAPVTGGASVERRTAFGCNVRQASETKAASSVKRTPGKAIDSSKSGRR